MYSAQLRQKPEFKHHKKPTYSVNHYSKIQAHQLENLKNDLEFKKAKAQATSLRNKTVQYRDKINYQNDLDRVRGYLSNPRLPAGTVERLRHKEEELRRLAGNITN